ncbi:DNA glycosylase AlkZ-like family protein [Homoserinibacter sp. YIM 151385]|uniref:DNA glycosylase AlkZ-like family protein n=1 Tax=Homoserinibacter sp. YIM 151385 TaxID=2985506 RepID=UPI0022F0052E|nr:crosslink repair DNA glycosylase YcaQ family protein [Homoserinibacter sp. YIM 151385]WBU36859.1 winged helix DNA-binding domain-containing protein [Homoserinibacter sp. YIM 151385]
MGIVRLDRDEARRIAVRAAGLDDEPPGELVELAGALAGLRVELTTTVAPAADHIAATRLGRDYRLGQADRALAAGRLFERDWVLHPMSELGLHLAGMSLDVEGGQAQRWVEANEPFRQGILDRIADLGPLTSREIPDEAVVPWPSTGWTDDRNATQMLQLMHVQGDLAVVGRVGRLRVWDIAERVYPSDTVAVPLEEARRRRAERFLAASGLLRDSTAALHHTLRDAYPVGELAEIDGVPGRWRVDPAQLGRPFRRRRAAILSPFDRLVVDRERLEPVFGYEYALEMYKPKAVRRWGGFALPILLGDRLVGKLDARADRSAGVLRVAAVHEDTPLGASEREEVEGAIEELAALQGLRVRR